MLPGEGDRIQYFHIDLQVIDPETGVNDTVTIRIRIHDLYLVDFKTQNGEWFQFSDSNNESIPSQFYWK